MEEGVSNLWTMRNDFHPRAAAFTSLVDPAVLDSFDVHAARIGYVGGKRGKKLGANAFVSMRRARENRRILL